MPKSEPIIKLFPGVPPLGTQEFRDHLAAFHAKHNPKNPDDRPLPFKLTPKGRKVSQTT